MNVRTDMIPVLNAGPVHVACGNRYLVTAGMKLARTARLSVPMENKHMHAGQSVVQFARRTDGSGTAFVAIKFFAKRAAYEEEAAVYRTSPPKLQRFMPAVVKYADNSDGALRDPFGNPLPPFIVMEKGDSLSDRCRNMPVDLFTAAQVASLLNLMLLVV